MINHPIKIVLTGSESSGKTTLAFELASAFSFEMVPEAARSYLSVKTEAYNLEDVRNIARMQCEAENQALGNGKPILCDTDMLTILIWQKEKFGVWDDDFYIHWKNNVNSLYLLCTPDIPWEPDPLRENPNDRDRLFQVHFDLLKSHRKPFEIISGKSNQRFYSAYTTILTRLQTNMVRM